MKVIEDSGDRRVEAHRRPLGVIGAILPWNFPLMLLAFKVPAALLAGNTMVLKPAPTTPLATLRFAELSKDVLPPGVLNVIADANDLGDAMTQHPDIRKISFTGSTATGKKVMAGAAETLKRITLELGGNDAAIVLDDADPKKRRRRAFSTARSRTAGQVCLAIKRALCARHSSMTRSATSWLRSPRPPWSTTASSRAPSSARCRTRCSSRRSRLSSRTPRRTAISSPAATRWTGRATSSRRPSCATSPKARGWSTRSSSARCCR